MLIYMEHRLRRLFDFVLLSLMILLIYDLFFESEMRQEVTSQRDFPRVYRVILILLYAIELMRNKIVFKSKFNMILVSIYVIIVLYIMFLFSVELGVYISLLKVLYLLFTYLFFFKVFEAQTRISLVKMKKFVWFSIVSISAFIIISRLGNISGTSKVYGDNNSYILLSFMPFIFSLEYKRPYILFVLLTIAVFFSLKRGAILINIIAFIPAFFISVHNTSKRIPKWVKNILILLSIITISNFAFLNYKDVIVERTVDLSIENPDDFGSGRGLMYYIVFKDFVNSTAFFNYFFGNGYNSIQDLMYQKLGSGLMAHSDIVNFIHSYGLFGLSLLIWFTTYQYIIFRRLKRFRSKYLISYFMIMIVFIFKSFYAGNFEQQNFSYLLMCYAWLNVSVKNEGIRI